MALTPKQERFCHEYVVDLNGAAAYRRAYPKAGTNADASAARLLAKPEVAARVAELQRERSERTRITAEWVLERLKAIIEAEKTSASAGVSALGLLMKHLGMMEGVAPSPAAPQEPQFDLSKLTGDQKSALLDAFYAARVNCLPPANPFGPPVREDT